MPAEPCRAARRLRRSGAVAVAVPVPKNGLATGIRLRIAFKGVASLRSMIFDINYHRIIIKGLIIKGLIIKIAIVIIIILIIIN